MKKDSILSASSSRVISALDFPNFFLARELVDELGSAPAMYKVGKQLFTNCGRVIVRYVLKNGGYVFLDLKYCDIPNTTAMAGLSAANLGVSMFNLHALAGSAAMETTMEELDKNFSSAERPKVLAVTVLTSFTYAGLLELRLVPELHYADPDELKKRQDFHIRDLVLHFARLAKKAGVDGVVASPQEASAIREACGEDFLITTPGVRRAGAKTDDQARIGTATKAVEDGADLLVVGRPINEEEKGLRIVSLNNFNEEVSLALAAKINRKE